MEKYKVVASINDVNLCKKNNFYFIKRNDGYMWDIAGTKEEVKNELERWLRDVDYNNEYMRVCEKYFIYVLECNEIEPAF